MLDFLKDFIKIHSNPPILYYDFNSNISSNFNTNKLSLSIKSNIRRLLHEDYLKIDGWKEKQPEKRDTEEEKEMTRWTIVNFYNFLFIILSINSTFNFNINKINFNIKSNIGRLRNEDYPENWWVEWKTARKERQRRRERDCMLDGQFKSL